MPAPPALAIRKARPLLFPASGSTLSALGSGGPARQVAGVASVSATRFQRQGIDATQYLNDGFMRLARLEVPRLDNDANFQEHGVLRLNLFGGK